MNDEFLPEIKDIIVNFLYELELKNIYLDVKRLGFDHVLDLLKTHYNKKLVRKLIYNNIKEIIFYQVCEIDPDEFGNLDYIKKLDIDDYFIIEIINDNKEKLLKNYSIEQINEYINFLKLIEINHIRYIGKDHMCELVNFIQNLINMNEIVLAKEVFDISYSNDFNEGGYYEYHFGYRITKYFVFDDIKFLKIIIDFMGDNLLGTINYILESDYEAKLDYKKLFDNLVALERFDLIKEISFPYANKITKTSNIDF